MDPFVRKMIFGGLAFGVTMLVLGGVLSAIYFHVSPRCSEAVVSESASPDGRWAAAIMERRCGEESPLYMHVNLRAAGDPILQAYYSRRSEAGQVFVIEEDTRDRNLAIEWSSPREITMRCPWCRSALVQKREEHWGPIAVHYELHP
jgi:hypothetical protein